MKSFPTEILTPHKVVFSGQVEELVLKDTLGYFGVLADHAPLMARLAPGKLKLIKDGQPSVYQSGSGFVQVSKERVSILLDEIK